MHRSIQPNEWVVIRLPSDIVKVERMVPNTTINLGKHGSFQTRHVLGRPFHFTYELLDPSEIKDGYPLRIVPAAELHADALIDQSEVDAAGNEDVATPDGPITPVDDPRNNKHINDDPASQTLTFEEIEALKEGSTGAGRDIINQLLQSHSAIDQKTAFSLAKYMLRKNKKYLKRFCILPLDVPLMAEWMMNEKEALRIMELRNESIGLLTSWANVHHDGSIPSLPNTDYMSPGRWLVVDDTGGLMVAAVAEKLGILHEPEADADSNITENNLTNDENAPPDSPTITSQSHPRKRPPPQMSANTNSITVLHSASQPNLSLLKYFNYDSNDPSPNHPLYTHLKSLSWMQLLSPESDPMYREPQSFPQTEISTWKSSKRSTYYRKRRRWERITSVIHATRSGGFSGLLISSWTDPTSILHHLVPLLAGAAQIVVYNPHIEPLANLADHYSTARRTAYLNTPASDRQVPSPDFPVDPTLLLGATVQTARVRAWQTLPGRTHPLMGSRGGAEGYVFHATRVVPAEGKVSARGKMTKKRKLDTTTDTTTNTVGTSRDNDSEIEDENEEDMITSS